MSDRALVLVTTSFPIRDDGSEAAGSFVADLAVELAQHVPVRVVAPGTTSQREPWASRVEVFRYAAPSKPLSTLRPWRPGDLKWLRRVLRGGQSSTRDAMSMSCGHAFALWGLPCGEWARRAAQDMGGSYSVWLLGSDVWSLGRLPLARQMLRRVMQSARTVYADGYQLAQDAMRIADVPVAFLPSTRRIALENVESPRKEPPYRLLFLGRWHPNKGVDLLMDALAMLGDDDWARIEQLEIHGGGALEHMVRERVAGLQAQGRPVVAGGFLAKSEAEATIARTDWLLIPSRLESIPVIFSDAMKLGRPVIAMPTGDLPALLREDMPCGVLASSISAKSFATAIRWAISQPMEKYGPGIVSQAGRFDLGELARRICEDEVGAHG